jgi:hypothetical protein
MQWRDSIVKAAVAGALVSATVLLVAGTASAGALYRWESENGTLSFADDPRRVPERYRDRVVEIRSEGLDGYGRFTPTDAGAQRVHGERLQQRLEGLREQSGAGGELPGVVVIEEPPDGHPLEGIALQSLQRTQGRRLVNTPTGRKWVRTTRVQTVDAPIPVLGVQADSESDEPVVVERVRMRPEGSLVTRTVTVVRQGDRVLSVIKPRSHQHSVDVPSEAVLER